MLIMSRANPLIKKILKVQQKKSMRQQEGLWWVEGHRELEVAFKNGIQVEILLVKEGAQVPDFAREDVPVQMIAEGIWSALVYRQSTETVAALVKAPIVPPLDPTKTILVLDRIEKPGNAGAILRSADGAGVGQVVLLQGACDRSNPNLIRASLGALFTLSVYEMTEDEFLAMADQNSLILVVASPDGTEQWPPVLPQGCTLIVGNEAQGVSQSLKDRADLLQRIPMRGQLDSLNVAQAATLLLYQLRGVASD